MTTDMPGLWPIGHLVNAREAVRRYAETGTVLDTGAVLDELDELRRLLLDVAGALDSLAADAMHTPGAACREHGAIAAAGAELRQLVAAKVHPPVSRLLLTATWNYPENHPESRRGKAAA